MSQTTKGNVIGMILHSRDFLELAAFQVSGIGAKSLNTVLLESSYKLTHLCYRLIKSVQGDEGLIEIIIPKTVFGDNLLDILEALSKYIQNLSDLFSHNFQKSIILEILELIYSLMYEVKYLK